MTIRSLRSLVLLCAAPLLVGSSFAQQVDSRISSVADREVARRQERVVASQEALKQADDMMKEKDFEQAMASYKMAYDSLPDSVATEKLRASALDGFSKAAVKLAEQRVSEGRYADAKILCEMVTKEGYNPNYVPAVRLMAHLEDQGYFNQTMTPSFIASVEDVKKLLTEGEGFYNTGRYDMSMKRADQVLNIDPYNIAARRLQEKTNLKRIEYGEAAYNETRSRRIWEVDRAWESPVKKYGKDKVSVVEQDPRDQRGTAYISAKLARIVIPRVEFRDATVREAVDYLKQKSMELDTAEPDPARRGVNIVLKIDGAGGMPAPAAEGTTEAAPAVSTGESRITLSLQQIPLQEALRYIANLANLKVKVEPYAVAIVPLSEPTDVLVTKDYRVPPGFIQNAPSSGGATTGGLGGGLGGGTSGGDSSGAGAALAGRMSAKEFLESNGVQFGAGASAYFLPSTSRLIVRNTQENLDLIDALVEGAFADVPKLVEIESKFVEITQNNLKELSFDWLLGAFNIGGERVFGSGGTYGNQNAPGTADYPFVDPAGNVVGQYPLTPANRTGNSAISANAIDALLFPTTGSSLVAPGVFGIAGVFTDPQFQLVIRAINQKKGVDLLSSPKVTTKSGQRAVIEIIREFRYPTEFDPPQIPQDFGGGTASSNTIAVFPVTPTTPTAFETRNTGVTLEVEPVVGPDGYTIDLNLVPQVVEFEGFINYGSPIYTINPSLFSGVVNAINPDAGRIEITPNTINQPIFSTRKVTTSVSIWDGQTVALGGLMREDVQKVEDKVPVLGDIPLVGRAFRSSVDQHLKRNLVIFVTARLIDPAGQPIGEREEQEEQVEPTINPDAFTIAPPEIPAMPK